jgi:2-polyprenyl-3-methyl-5-hydroxy-6-metoxy-1,4-benzoquinol methylase
MNNTALDSNSIDRVERERVFHDHRFAVNPGRNRMLGSVTGSITLDALTATYHTVKPFCAGATVLDYGCAQGEASVILRRYGAMAVQGIDISPVAVQQAEENARAAGVDRVSFQVMNAEQLEFSARSFDVVFGIGILHHLNVSQACSEIARVLRPSGTAVFLEPLGHNPFINLIRRLTPGSRTVDEHPLLVKDLDVIGRFFERVDCKYVNLMTLLTAPLVAIPGRSAAQSLLGRVDTTLFSVAPWMGRYAWNVVLTMRRPVKSI